MKNAIKFLLILFFLTQLAQQTHAQEANSSYIIQEADWLSRIAETAYGNPHLYYRIIEGTQRKAAEDESFAPIARANAIQVGSKIWIPALPPETNLIAIPKTNCEIRLWYNFQIVAIGVINEKWEKDGIELETRAHKAYEMRHQARINARFMMQNKEEVKALQDRDIKKYGNPDGPTFEYLLKRNTDKGLTLEEAYEAIIASASNTDKRYNADCQ